MKEELIKILPDLKEALAQGITYGGDLFNRAVNYYKITTLVSIGAFFVLSVVSSIGLFKAFKYLKDYDDFFIFIWFLILILCLFCIVCFAIEVCNYIKLKYIPEVFIIEKIT